ncbi:unnamed protein product [Cuscuta europaea]|uniref:Uncharacterized protein n=1 Tax=Cuscuta europaea TaxID=41803 RepID=A0A9P0ZIP6_CUSEU|nr:unnamed protein product [Cuscuta europaea]
MEESALQKQKADEALAEARRQLREAEEALRVGQAAFSKILENAKTAAMAEGKAEAEKIAVEAAKKAAEDAEAARGEAVAKAREDVVVGFVEDRWRTEGHKNWVASVVKESVDDWFKGPGWEWMARKGKEYYDGVSFSLRPSSTERWPDIWGWTRRPLTRQLMVSPLSSQTPGFPYPRAWPGLTLKTSS